MAQQRLEPAFQHRRRPAPRQALSPELRAKLEQEFAPDVALLSELLGRDLAALWWKREQPARPSTDAPEPVLSR